jgi:hypothetical protein
MQITKILNSKAPLHSSNTRMHKHTHTHQPIQKHAKYATSIKHIHANQFKNTSDSNTKQTSHPHIITRTSAHPQQPQTQRHTHTSTKHSHTHTHIHQPIQLRFKRQTKEPSINHNEETKKLGAKKQQHSKPVIKSQSNNTHKHTNNPHITNTDNKTPNQQSI